jgi:hypothetical protein
MSRSVEVIEELLRAGMNVARFNFSHGSHDYHQVRGPGGRPHGSAWLRPIPWRGGGPRWGPRGPARPPRRAAPRAANNPATPRLA